MAAAKLVADGFRYEPDVCADADFYIPNAYGEGRRVDAVMPDRKRADLHAKKLKGLAGGEDGAAWAFADALDDGLGGCVVGDDGDGIAGAEGLDAGNVVVMLVGDDDSPYRFLRPTPRVSRRSLRTLALTPASKRTLPLGVPRKSALPFDPEARGQNVMDKALLPIV